MRIDEMPAGREMDVLIAENIMGWAVHQRNTAWWVKVADENEVTTEVMGFTYGKDRFAPSTNIADAWEVVEKMGNCLFACGRSDAGAWEAYFFFVNSGVGKLSEAHGDTAPLAICRCALMAMGVKINGDS